MKKIRCPVISVSQGQHRLRNDLDLFIYILFAFRLVGAFRGARRAM